MDTNVPNFLEEPAEEVQEEAIFEETTGYCQTEVEQALEEAPSVEEQKAKELAAEEARKKYIKALAPEYKADFVYKLWLKEGHAPISGQPKRRLMRSLVRDAKKGKLDKYLL